MNRADIRSAARSITELEEADVSSDLLNLFVKDGYDRMISLERRWPFFEVTTTKLTTQGVREYALATFGAGNWREVSSIMCLEPVRRLTHTSFEDAEEAFLGAPEWSGPPQWWSQWGGSVHIWPLPSSTYTLHCRGYRKPADWHLSDGAEVDADERLHRPLINFVVSELYKMQEDTEMSAFHRAAFDEGVRLAHADIMRASVEQPLILAGGRPRRWG